MSVQGDGSLAKTDTRFPSEKASSSVLQSKGLVFLYFVHVFFDDPPPLLPLYISSIRTSSRYAVIVIGSLYPRFINNCLTMDHILHSDVLCSSVSLSLIAESVGLMGSWSVRVREDSVLEGLEGDHLIIRLHVIMTCVCV